MKLFYVTLLFPIFIYSQNLIVTYRTVVLDEKSTFVEFSENELLLNQNASIYYTTRLDSIFSTKIGDLISTPSEKKREMYMFKDLDKKQIQSYRQFSKGLVIDSTYSVKWQITNDRKNILGYNCQSAIGHFRGRDYIVFFTIDVPIKEGPFKFDGLPGLILQVTSEDGVVKIIAKGIKKTDEVVINPFLSKKHNKIMNWEEYTKIYEKQFKIFDAIPITVDEKGYSGKTTIPKRFIEVMVK